MKILLIRLTGDTHWYFGVMASSTGSVEDFIWRVGLKLRLDPSYKLSIGGSQHDTTIENENVFIIMRVLGPVACKQSSGTTW